MKVAIVIPVFNEASTISTIVKDVARFGIPVVVDDASSDGSGEAARAAGAEVVRLDANRGYDGALAAGLARAEALGVEAAVTFDGDGQFDAAMLPDVLAPLREGRADLVLGIRTHLARPAERLFGRYTRWRYRVPDLLCGVKGYAMDLYRRHRGLAAEPSVNTALALSSLREGGRVVTVPARVRPRRAGRPRFGSWAGANLRILRAMAAAVWRDLKGDAGK